MFESWWWTVFFIIFLSGAMGGFARFQWDKTEEKANSESWFGYVVMGIAAAFLVPLFLNTISSTLIIDTSKEPSKYFILIGFCIAASMYAKQFIGSVAKKALEKSDKAIEESKKAKGLANEANQNAKLAEIDARSADNRAIALYKPIDLINKDNIEAALIELDFVITFDPKNSEAWAWKAYCLKRQSKFEVAVKAIETALQLEGKEIGTWLYNMACYKCLGKYPISEVIVVLERMKASSTPEQILWMYDSLQKDEDFATIYLDEFFIKFINSLN